MDDPALLRDTLQGVAEAVQDERAASADSPSSRYQLREGRQIGRTGSRHLWSFEFDGEAPIQSDSIGRLITPDREPIFSVALAVGDFDLVLSVGDELGETLAEAVLEINPDFILEALGQRLEDASSQMLDTRMLSSILDLDELEVGAPVDEEDPTRPPAADGDDPGMTAEQDVDADAALSYEQMLAVEHATQDGLRFVWGPPGTGKTSTLAATVASLAESGRRVLVVAHANAAVDVAMVRVAHFMRDSPILAADQVLRTGTPHLEEARDCKQILPDEIIGRRFPELSDRRRALDAERRSISRKLRSDEENVSLAERLGEIREEMTQIDQRLTDGRRSLVDEARVIGCTLASLIIDPQLWSLPRDAVIIDEASMASLPFVIAIAATAPRTLACFGDFRQLPPVAISERASARAWFGRDVFELAGVVSRLESGERDPRLAILRTQYRMGETIAGAVSEVAYFSLLSTHVDAIVRARRISTVAPVEGAEVVLVDTNGLGSTCEVDANPRSFSRFNLRSAALVACLAEQLAEGEQQVALVSPYRAQAAVLRSLVRGNDSIAAATMHRFQGSERAAVVVDLVDTEPMASPSRLTGKDQDLALRLMNVGVSRAMGKLVVVGDFAFVRDRSPVGSPLVRFLDAFEERGATVVAATELLDNAAASLVTWASDWWSGVDALTLRGAGRECGISVSDASYAGDSLRDALEMAQRRAASLVVHAPLDIAAQLDGIGLDLRLLPLGAGQMCIVGGVGVVVGGNHPGRPAAVVYGKDVVSAIRRLMLQEGTAWRS